MIKKIFLLIFLLIFLVKGDEKQKIININPAQFSGNITLSLRHGIWKHWQDTRVYQTLILELICKQSECQSEVFAQAPRFEGQTEYLGTVENIKIDRGWHLDIEVNFRDFFSEIPIAKGDYQISIIPYKNTFFAEYSGKLNNHNLQGKVEAIISPFPQLISNYSNTYSPEKNSNKFNRQKLFLKNYQIHRDINYLTVNNHQLFLDIYQRKTERPSPTLIYIHGGGWYLGNKPSLNAFWPYLIMGFSVVNIQYRLADISPAPAAVEDTLCSLFWVIDNAEKYNFDLDKIVVTGASAGGHLALMTGMANNHPQLTKNCPFVKNKSAKVAAIINRFGPTDVQELLTGEHPKDYALKWFNGVSNQKEITSLVSPISYIKPDLPPILSIHGAKDVTVPYSQVVKLHDNLAQVGVTNGLLRLPERSHGDFSETETRQIYNYIENFLIYNQILN
jgi:acetyl esterase/lipase